METILIVEDHKDFRQAVRNFLEINHIKANFVEASSGEEGVILAKRVKPKLILMDFCLGGINGIEAAAKIKENLPNCSIIILTMFNIKEIGKVYSRNLVKDFISKSDLFEKLIPKLKTILRSVK
jgi:DNA-binding NarL/FixJ family response regulator